MSKKRQILANLVRQYEEGFHFYGDRKIHTKELNGLKKALADYDATHIPIKRIAKPKTPASLLKAKAIKTKVNPESKEFLAGCIKKVWDETLSPKKLRDYLADKIPKNKIDGVVKNIRHLIYAPCKIKGDKYILEGGVVFKPVKLRR